MQGRIHECKKVRQVRPHIVLCPANAGFQHFGRAHRVEGFDESGLRQFFGQVARVYPIHYTGFQRGHIPYPQAVGRIVFVEKMIGMILKPRRRIVAVGKQEYAFSALDARSRREYRFSGAYHMDSRAVARRLGCIIRIVRQIMMPPCIRLWINAVLQTERRISQSQHVGRPQPLFAHHFTDALGVALILECRKIRDHIFIRQIAAEQSVIR